MPHIITHDDVDLRPKRIVDFIGQHKLLKNLSVFINAAKRRSVPLDHTLFYGPPGLGKTTLSHIVANELGVNLRTISGPVLTKTGDLAAILTNLQRGDVLFIDEIHRMSSTVEEALYSAMEDFCIDLVIGEGPTARTMRLNLSKFTLVGATTRLGLLSNPLKDRFGIQTKLNFYSQEELAIIVKHGAATLSVLINDDATHEISKRSRGTPRIALRLLRRIRDFADVDDAQEITLHITNIALSKLGVDDFGFSDLDRQYIQYIAKHHGGGPVGVNTIAAGLSEDVDTIENAIEPYMMQIGFVDRSSRGRVLTKVCLDYALRFLD